MKYTFRQLMKNKVDHASIYAIAYAMLKIDGSGRMSHANSGHFSNDFVKFCMWESGGLENPYLLNVTVCFSILY